MSTFDSVIKKITTPPGAQNCARLNVVGDEAATTNRIAKFALGMPAFNYQPGTVQCRTHVNMPLAVGTAVHAVMNSGAPAGREQNAAFVRAFFAFDEVRGFSRCRVVDGYAGEYRLSRELRVPTKPTFTILENGQLVPVTVCGWKSLPLDNSQMRLWMTMLESGLYSHADFRHSPAEIVFFIEEQTDEGPMRVPLTIRRGDYSLFSESEMREQAELYVRAQAAALPIAEAAWLERERKRQAAAREENVRRDDPNLPGPTLFD